MNVILLYCKNTIIIQPHNIMQNKIVSTTVWDEKTGTSRPAFRYNAGQGYEAFSFPAFVYDPMNATSRKSAMKMAYNTGIEQIEKLQREVEEEFAKEEMKKAMKKSETSDDD